MSYKIFSLHNKIFNIWVAYNTLLFFSLKNFSHWEKVPFLSYLNYSLYFLMSLLCFYIFKKVTYNKYIFFNFFLFSLLYSLNVINIFIGDNYSFGNNYLLYYVFEYRKFGMCMLTSLVVIFIVIEYMYHEKSPILKNLYTLLIIAPFGIYNFRHYLFNKNYILTPLNDVLLYKSIFLMDWLPVFFILLYIVFVYKYDKPIGRYTHSIMGGFFVFLSIEILDSFSELYNIKLFNISQIILFLNLCYFSIVLNRKLSYTYSEFGEFYEAVIFSGKKLGIPIKRKIDAITTLSRLLRNYVEHPKNVFLLVGVLLSLILSYTHFHIYIKMNILIIIWSLYLIFVVGLSIIKKRENRDNLL